MSLNDLGAVPASTTIYLFWTSHDGATGANEAASNLAVGDILIYKNGSVTQRSSTSGFTLLDTDGIDFDSLTGVNGVSIDLSDNTDAGFYAVGSWYTVILGPITIDTQTVYLNLASFRIVAAEGITGKPKVDVDGFGGTAGTFAAGRPEVNLSHIAGSAVSTTTAQLGVNAVQISGDGTAADNLEAEFDGNGYVGYVRRNTAQAGAAGSITLDASASATNDTYRDHKVVLVGGTGAGQARIISAYDGSTKVATTVPNWATNPDNTSVFMLVAGTRMDVGLWKSSTPSDLISGRVDANTQAMANGVVTAAVIATDAIDADAIADNAINAGAIASDAITSAKIADGAITAAKIADGAIDAATFAADVDAEVLSYLVDDATRIDASALNTATGTTIPAIVADTNELQTDWVNGGRLDLLVDAILADTNELQTDWANGGRLDLLIDAIKAKTDLYNTTLADSVPADGTRPTDREALYMICQFLLERVVTGTAVSVKKVDGTTELFTLVLDDATSPTSISRDG